MMRGDQSMEEKTPETMTFDETSEPREYSPDELDKKIQELFPGESVNKRLTKTGLLSSRALPSFVSDWLISKFSSGNQLDTLALQRFLDNYLPDKS